MYEIQFLGGFPLGMDHSSVDTELLYNQVRHVNGFL